MAAAKKESDCMPFPNKHNRDRGRGNVEDVLGVAVHGDSRPQIRGPREQEDAKTDDTSSTGIEEAESWE